MPPGWDKERRGLNENDPKKYEAIRDCMMELLTELRKKNSKKDKSDKTTTQNARTKSKEKRAQGKGPDSEPSPKKTKPIQTESQRIADLLRQVLKEPNKENVEAITRRGRYLYSSAFDSADNSADSLKYGWRQDVLVGSRESFDKLSTRS